MSADSPVSNTRCARCGDLHDLAEVCPAALTSRVGTVVDGKYEIVRLLGRGGMGEVYEARHRVLGRRVAVKLLHPVMSIVADVLRRFENEARAAGSLEHENVAAVFDVGVLPDGARFLVMEYLDGTDLDRLLARTGPLPIARAVDLVVQVCRGLAVVHARGIVHRDLKPANLFLLRRADGGDLVKVIDFGIAKLRGMDRAGATTEVGVPLGTAYYMSPEQARGDVDVDRRTDVYALGVILFELLTGRRPHEGQSVLQILAAVLSEAPPPLRSLRPEAPEALAAVVARALAKDAGARHATVEALADDLRPFGVRAPAAPPSARSIGLGEEEGGASRAVDPRRAEDGERSLDGLATTGGAARAASAAATATGVAGVPRRSIAVPAIVAVGLVGVAVAMAASALRGAPAPGAPARADEVPPAASSAPTTPTVAVLVAPSASAPVVAAPPSAASPAPPSSAAAPRAVATAPPSPARPASASAPPPAAPPRPALTVDPANPYGSSGP
jgi:serine/threonine-protein kinase